MNYKPYRLLSFLLLAFVITFTACDDDPKMPANLVEFEANVAGLSADENSLAININLSRAAATDVTLNLIVNAGTLAYGTDYTTNPSVTENTINVTIPKGQTNAGVTLTKVDGVGFAGDETISFTITDVVGEVVLGANAEIIVSFSEITVADATMNIQGGGPTFANRVFIDLSANRQTAVKRDTWDLGFYTANGEFKVVLNTAVTMLARPLDKTTLGAVTSADTVGMGLTFTTDAYSADNLPFMDHPSGDMSQLAFAPVSATDGENVVYIINRGKSVEGTQRSWKKVKILRNGTGYTVQHADIGSTTFQTVQVTRDANHLFNYVSLDDNSVVTVEPETGKWDIAYTVFITQIGLPYSYNDFIIQNRSGVETAQVLISAHSYEAFAEENLTGITFTADQAAIGANWRNGGGPSTPPSLRTDRFYLVKDADGNIYKVKFTALTQSGERGRPAIEYALVKKAE